ncbi:MAG TPA: hypothetical protein VIL74_18125 [Pyrinomonadaceae bacterium]|jgi:hypothetical protein
MKKLFCLTFVLLSALAAFAQEKTIDKTEFDAALKNRFLKFEGRAYRETRTIEDVTPKDDRFKFFSRSVLEFAPPNRSRLLYESESWLHRKRTETIRIDQKFYLREDDGEWTEKNLAEFQKTLKSVSGSDFLTADEQTEYKTLGTQILNDLKTTVYVRIERRKTIYKPKREERFWTSVTKFWLDETGGIVREEELSEARAAAEKTSPETPYRERRTTVWEFDPKIKIEAPRAAK